MIELLFTADEWVAGAKAIATAVGVTELIKRFAKASGAKPSHLSLWALSILIALVIAMAYKVRLLGAATMGTATGVQLADAFLFALLVAGPVPFLHWLIVLKGADFFAFMVKKWTGYDLNLRDVASGRAYKVRVRK